MKANLIVLLLAGCGAVNQSSLPYGGDDDGSGSGSGSDMGSDVHPIGALYGAVMDERADTIDFSTGEPVHTHTGAVTDLSSGCPDVYKYAYLTGEQEPKYGRQTNANPLAWHLDTGTTDIDPSASAYRVRSSDAVALDWTEMSPDSKGIFDIELHRDGAHAVAALAQDGMLYVDARIRDSAGNETIKSACWQNHVIAAPLDLAAATQGELFSWNYASHSTISHVLEPAGTTNGVGVVVIPFTQQTAEPTSLVIGLPTKPSGTGTKEIVEYYSIEGTYPENVSCLIGNACDSPVSTRATTSAPIGGTWQLEVIDDANGTVVCTGSTSADCTIPARTGTEAPHMYHVVLGLAAEPSIAPPIATGYADMPLGTKWYTGSADASKPTGCAAIDSQGIAHCTEAATYWYWHIINDAKLAFDDVKFTFATHSIGTANITASYAPASAALYAAHTWDTGVAGF